MYMMCEVPSNYLEFAEVPGWERGSVPSLNRTR